MRRIIFFLLLISSFFSCKKEDETIDEIATGNRIITLTPPPGFPYPTIPSDNQPTLNRVELGRQLFFDPVLSRDSTIACVSCHLPNLKFTDGLPKSDGISGRQAFRNSMTLLNVAYQPTMFWDGGVPNLEQQVLAPIENPNEMDFNIIDALKRLNRNSTYVEMFREAYGDTPTVSTLTKAIACFERTLFTSESRYDRLQLYGDSTALNASEKRGMDLFFGERGECFHCHGGINFTDYSFKNNGLYINYPDSGRARVTGRTTDIGKFKVPSLRNVEHTAPYMHDGTLATLEDVIDFYNTGGQPHPNRSGLILPLNLTPQEKSDLINFLKTLSDL